MNMLADVIVIGGGPSGVAAALELRRQGVEKVALLEREPYLGGATRHCSHSPFGMLEFAGVYFGASYGRKLEVEAAKAGVKVLTGHSVVRLGDDGTLTVTSAHGVEEMRAARILYATGAREKPRSARLITGDRPIGVVTTGTLQAYVAFHGLMPFRKPIIVGSELVTLSGTLTCLMHGARPVAVIEPRSHALARAPFAWFPSLVGIPFHRGTDLIDVQGRTRVEAVTIRKNGSEQTLECDGVLLTGQFTPESSLFLQSTMGVDRGSAGPMVDQSGRTVNPVFFAAGNVLRAVETGGWAFREGRAVGKSLAADLQNRTRVSDHVPIIYDDPIKLVVPSMLRRGDTISAAFSKFQLRVTRRVKGRLCLEIDAKEIWNDGGVWMPERRILVPIPSQATRAETVRFRIAEE